MLTLLVLSVLGVWQTDLDRYEEVVFFPSYACRGADGVWRGNARGWLFRDGMPSLDGSAGTLLDIATAVMGTVEPSALLLQRATPFLAQSEPGQRISVRAGGRTFISSPSEAGGYFELPIRLTDKEASELRRDGS